MSERKYCFLSQKKIIFIGVVCHVRERLFSKCFFFLENNLKKISLIFIRIFRWLKIIFRWLIFFYVTKHWKTWKTIFIEGFPAKQTELASKFLEMWCLIIWILKNVTISMFGLIENLIRFLGMWSYNFWFIPKNPNWIIYFSHSIFRFVNPI